MLLEFLYKDDISVLAYRSFSGRTRKLKKTADDAIDAENLSQPNTFQAISPQKKDTLFTLHGAHAKRISHATRTVHSILLKKYHFTCREINFKFARKVFVKLEFKIKIKTMSNI